jgi:uncharacterized membrane protein
MVEQRSIRSRLVGANVPRGERIASGVLGGALVLNGVRRGGWLGALFAIVGGALVLRGATGRSGLYRTRAARKGVEVRRTVTIQATPHAIYALWRDPRQLARFMSHVKSVELDDDGASRWIVREGPVKLSWRAELVEDVPDRRLRWRSLPGGSVDHEGSIDLREAEGDRGTIVDVRIRYRPPGGVLAAGMLGDLLRGLPGLQLEEELARLRMIVETGEIATSARRPGELGTHEKLATGVVP